MKEQDFNNSKNTVRLDNPAIQRYNESRQFELGPEDKALECLADILVEAYFRGKKYNHV